MADFDQFDLKSLTSELTNLSMAKGVGDSHFKVAADTNKMSTPSYLQQKYLQVGCKDRFTILYRYLY